MKIKLRTKVVCMIVILSLIIAAIAIVISYTTYENTIYDYYKQTIKNIAHTAQQMIDAERIGRYADELEPDEQYQQMYDDIVKIKENNHVTYLYVQKVVGDTAITIIDPDDEFRTEYPVSEEASFDDAFITYSEGFGWLCTAAVEVKDASGETTAIVGADISMNDVMTAKYQFLILVVVATLIATVVAVVIMILLVGKILVTPINKLASATSNYVASREADSSSISENSPISQLEIKSHDEVGNLAHSIKTMEQEINRYIDNLTRITAEKERIGAELNVATQIQASMLPSTFPAFPERKEFDTFATMDPAKEVGGDFYDFFFTDDDHFAMVMADVSGKGVPAALFMVIAKTLIKNWSQTLSSPKDILEKVNQQLCENNEAEMFVTVWLGILEISTGKLRAANAGHEFPVIKKANGQFELLRDKHGFVLAGMETARYREYELTIDKGDILYLYTDGVPESTNHSNELFGTDRMIAALNASSDSSAYGLLAAVRQAIDDFVLDAPQFDDITMMAFEMKAAPQTEADSDKAQSGSRVLSTETKKVSTADIIADVEGWLRDNTVDEKSMKKIIVAVDELAANILQYSKASHIEVVCSSDSEGVSVRFTDNGIRYNPLDKKDPDVTLPIDKREIGGLGIYMVKNTMDSVEYRYDEATQSNIFTIYKKQG